MNLKTEFSKGDFSFFYELSYFKLNPYSRIVTKKSQFLAVGIVLFSRQENQLFLKSRFD